MELRQVSIYLLTGYVIDNLRTVQRDRLWMSEDGQDSIDNLTVLL